MIGFTAYHPNSIDYYDVGETVTFSDILSNFGDHYNGLTSTFTWHYHGIYFLTASFNPDTSDMFAYIMVRGQSIARTMAYIDEDNNAITHSP